MKNSLTRPFSTCLLTLFPFFLPFLYLSTNIIIWISTVARLFISYIFNMYVIIIVHCCLWCMPHLYVRIPHLTVDPLRSTNTAHFFLFSLCVNEMEWNSEEEIMAKLSLMEFNDDSQRCTHFFFSYFTFIYSR